MNVAVVVNPSAASGRFRHRLPQVLSTLERRLRIEVLTTRSSADAVTACGRALDGGAQALVAIGGDGTFHTALRALDGRDVPFALIPAGTCNDMADALGLPADPVAAAAAAAESLADGNVQQVDLAEVVYPDGRTLRFGTVLAIGYAASVADRGGRLKWPAGPRRYDVAALLELPRFRGRVYDVTLDGVAAQLPAVLFSVGNTGRCGGKLHVCPDADIADGYLDVTTQGPNSLPATLGSTMRLFSGVRSATDTSTRRFRVRAIHVASAGHVTFADGEPLPPPPFTVHCAAGALTVPKVG
ncbi:diacylglycerol/lipid kinase family protein [Microbispora bryophytorum]|uniref:diacylglycerol/lipid kinase family protein n=1 Tax=Microbispora bryophytorum TaxID=1460882 RepID=UPI0033D668E8